MWVIAGLVGPASGRRCRGPLRPAIARWVRSQRKSGWPLISVKVVFGLPL